MKGNLELVLQGLTQTISHVYEAQENLEKVKATIAEVGNEGNDTLVIEVSNELGDIADRLTKLIGIYAVDCYSIIK